MAKQIKSEAQLSAVFFRYGDSLFRLFYLHTKRPSEAERLLEDVLLQYAVCGETFANPDEERRWLLTAAHRVAMDYYAKKLRRCPADEQIRRAGRDLPFAVTKELCAVLRLPYALLSPVALCHGDGESAAFAAKITGTPQGLVARRLKKAVEKSGLSADALTEWCETVVLPEEQRSRALYGVLNALHEKHFGVNSGARAFKRRLDRAIPFVALGVIVVCVAAVIAVRAGVFGTFTPSSEIHGEVYGSAVSENTPSAAENHATAVPSATPEVSGTIARLDFPIYVPDASGLTQYNYTDTQADAALVVAEMAALGAFPEDVSLTTLEYRRNGEVLDGIRSGEQLQVRLIFSESLQDYLDTAPSTAALEAIAKTFRAFYDAGDMTLATLEIYAGNAPVAVSGHEINCTTLMYGELPVTAVIEADE